MIDSIDFGLPLISKGKEYLRAKQPKAFRFIARVAKKASRSPMAVSSLIAALVFAVYYLFPGLLWMAARSDATKPYWQDATHFIYSIAMMLGVLPLSAAVLKARATLRATRKILDPSEIEDWNRSSSIPWRLALSWPSILFSLLCGLTTFAILADRATDPNYAYWWGSVSFGWIGFYFSFVAAQMVFWGMLAAILVVAYSWLVSSLGRRIIVYDPINPDMTSGLRPLGTLLLQFWWFTICLAGAVYLVFAWGYLGIEKNPVIWLVAIVASSLLPLSMLLPITAVAKAVNKSKHRFLHHLKAEHLARDPGNQSAVLELMNIQEAVGKQGILPFRARAFFVLFVFNGLQFVAAVSALLPK